MKNIKLGYIGSGTISNFHIPVIKYLRFKIDLFYSRNFDKVTNALDIDIENKIINSISAIKNITIILVTCRNESLKI